MLRLMIADDEYIVRQGLKKSLPWLQMDVQCVGEADCVSAAIETAREVQPDIVLCDIRMPGGSGLKIIEEVRRMIPWVQFIMLTAYSDRDLMREAIRLGVCDYLFKPAELSEIQNAISCARDRVIAYQDKRSKDREYRSFLFEQMDNLRETLIRQMIEGDSEEARLRSDAEKLQIDLRGPQYRLVKVHASTDNWQRFLSETSVLLEQFHASAAPVDAGKQLYVILLNCSPEYSSSRLNAALNPRHSQNIRISERCDTLSELPVVYRLMAEESDSRDIEQRFESSPETLRMREHVLEAIKYRDSADEIYRMFQEFWEQGHRDGIDESVIFAEGQRIIGAIRVMYGLSDPPSGTRKDPLKEMAALCLELRESSYQVNDVAGKVVYLLKKRYAEDLSCEQIAAELFVSTSYMSRTLKHRTGHGFLYWLNYYRIEAAKTLLSNPEVNIEQVACAVGYHSYRVFSNNFRKYTQTTATSWRNDQ